MASDAGGSGRSRVTSDHQATPRSATMACRNPGIAYGTPPSAIDSRE